MEVKMSIRSQKGGIIRVEYRLVGPNTALEKGLILGRIYFEKSTIDFWFTRFSINSVFYHDMIEALIEDQERDIYSSSRLADNPGREYMRGMVGLFREIGYMMSRDYPPQKFHTL